MKARVFRDPIHGLVGIEELDVARLLDTRAFQRLRRVRQMGFAWLVYPGAEHSRFGHALGAYHVAERVTRELPIPAEVARDVKVAALLHDVGHGPFSHAWEVALGGPGHEEWGRRIVTQDPEVVAALRSISRDLPSRIEAFFAKSYLPRYAKKLVSSQLDVDRMDYLLRDAHFSGVGYSAYDLDWLIHALGIQAIHEGPDREDLVIDYRRGINALEQYLYGRSYMYAQVYYHKTVRAAECMFLAVMRRFAELSRRGREEHLPQAARLARGEDLSVQDYLALDDAHLSVALDKWGEGDDPVLSDLSRRLASRRLFKTIELGDDPGSGQQLLPSLEAAAREAFGDRAPYYFALDHARRLGYDGRPGEEIYVVGHPTYGTIDLGKLLQEMPIGRPVVTVRVICAPELLERFQGVIMGSRLPHRRQGPFPRGGSEAP